MALVDLLEVDKQFESQIIFQGINFHIDEYERIVIVGRNGSGKSTLMKIVSGEIEPDAGKRIVRQGLKIEMLAQQPVFEAGLSVREAIENELTEIQEAKKRYEVISAKLAEDFDNKSLLEEHSKLSAFLDFHNAWNLDDKIERILKEFDLKIYEVRPVNLLSGGEQRRVALASLLLKKPDILLLDEPTNHLDVYMVEFLEELLLKEKFTLLLISHDRYFIDRIATRTVEIDDHKLRSFKGGYESYLQQKEALLHAMRKEHENLLKLLKAEEEWLNRGVKARLKRNEGRKKRVLEMREQAKKNPAMIRKIKLELEREKHHFNREDGVSRKKVLFEIEHLEKRLGDKLLIHNFSNRILQKDRIAIVGKNGSGKSTLLKLLLGREKPDGGVIKRGDFTIGYFDQHREMLDDNKNLIETFCPFGGDRVDVQGKNMHVFGYLKNFLFPKEYLDKKIGVLSGGEKNRVALALLFTKKVDCLILDEPTNDLDIPTINILEEYLLNFPGALIFVSHDRYFVDKIAKKLFIFKGEGIVEESYQPYSEFLAIEKEIKNIEQFEHEIEIEKEKPKVEPKKRKKKLSYNEKRELESLPEEIESLENRIAEINACLADPECYQEKGIQNLTDELNKLEVEYNLKADRYLELLELQEELEGE
ncbi:ABC-F family ATP-binding cassette domain-containing protein [Hydrogenimonas thermophila]|uniref:ribosomal protection-like ABC-F family protein n=1 Tax=Hydrogenimonas thermophila TaxID=223786 RepID=UPI0029371B45|nr:ABC-F family ATP-binding cassette domain-containing protein [Hydrogenimonas thermophila]WOE71090.1 ABC-F family ATP-binding cassette domain-containing protein [Hydrogenimonas thermophila]WOE73608.1 ABC-F family ATP-binding cassette domain-containing protein [Hydrogenimonas thermophila]